MDGAQVCIEMDVTKDPIKELWIGTPRNPQSFYQSIEFEALPAYCMRCHVQGHNVKTCKGEGKNRKVNLKEQKEKAKTDQVWVIKENMAELPINMVQKGESSMMGDRQLIVSKPISALKVMENPYKDRTPEGVEIEKD